MQKMTYDTKTLVYKWWPLEAGLGNLSEKIKLTNKII